MSSEKEKTVKCSKCCSQDTYVIFEHQHSGLRGHCKNCNATWPEK